MFLILPTFFCMILRHFSLRPIQFILSYIFNLFYILFLFFSHQADKMSTFVGGLPISCTSILWRLIFAEQFAALKRHFGLIKFQFNWRCYKVIRHIVKPEVIIWLSDELVWTGIWLKTYWEQMAAVCTLAVDLLMYKTAYRIHRGTRELLWVGYFLQSL